MQAHTRVGKCNRKKEVRVSCLVQLIFGGHTKCVFLRKVQTCPEECLKFIAQTVQPANLFNTLLLLPFPPPAMPRIVRPLSLVRAEGVDWQRAAAFAGTGVLFCGHGVAHISVYRLSLIHI